MPQIYVKIDGKPATIERATDDELLDSLDQARAQFDNVEVTGVSDDFARSAPAPTVSDSGTGVIGALGQGFSQGATFAFGDEIGAFFNQAWLGDQPVGLSEGVRESYGQTADEPLSNYEIMRDVIRGGQAAAREESPWAYGVGEFGGALGATAPLLAGGAQGQVLSRLGPRALAGAGEGALYGLGLSEGETAGEMAADVGVGAGVGGTLAAAVPPVLRTVGRGVGRAVNRIWQEINETPTQEARRHIQRALVRDEVTEDVAEELAEQTGGQGMLLDISPEMTGLGETVAQRPGGGRQIIGEALEERQLGQQGRIADVVEEEIETVWQGNYRELIDALDAEKRTQSRPLYREAYSKPVRQTPEMQAILNQAKEPGSIMKRAIDQAQRIMRAAGPIHGGTTELLDYTTRALRDMADSAFRSGNSAEGTAIRGLRNRLNEELYKSVPELQAARSVYAGAAQLEDAAEYGRNLLRGTKYLDDIEGVVDNFTDTQKDAFRVGAIRSIVDKIEGANVTHNATRRLLNSTRVRNLMRVAFPDDESAQRFFNRMFGEETMSASQQRIMGGPATARRLAQEADLGSVGEVAGAVADAKTGGGMAIARRVIDWLRGDKPLTDEGSRELARLLTQSASGEVVEDLSQIGVFGTLRDSIPYGNYLPTLRERLPGDTYLPPLWRGAATGGTPLLLED